MGIKYGPFMREKCDVMWDVNMDYLLLGIQVIIYLTIFWFLYGKSLARYGVKIRDAMDSVKLSGIWTNNA